MAPVIRVDDETWDMIRGWARRFGKEFGTPNDVLKQVLKVAEGAFHNEVGEKASTAPETVPEAQSKQNSSPQRVINEVSLLSFCREKAGQTFYTLAKRRPFVLQGVNEKGELRILPSTGKPRSHGGKYLRGVLERFTLTGSWRPVDYAHLTLNAAYILPVLKAYLDRPS